MKHKVVSADPTLIHFAVIRDGLWSPGCSDQVGWIVPLANLHTQLTCPICKARGEKT